MLKFVTTWLLSATLGFSAWAGFQCQDMYEPTPVASGIVQLMANMKWEGRYEEGFCDSNVQRLLNLMKQQGFNLREAEVLYIIPTKENPWGDFVIYPHSNVHYVEYWDFHAVLRYRGRIYDLDTIDRPSETMSYFKKMFDATVFNDRGIMLRLIPGKDYLKDYQDHRGFTADFQRGWRPQPGELKDASYYMGEHAPYPLRTLLESL